MGKYQVNITLSRLANVAISKHLWKHSRLKSGLKSCIENNSDPEDDGIPSLVSEITDDINFKMLSEHERKELEVVVAKMGLEIWKWIGELRHPYCWKFVPWLKSPELSNSIDYIWWTDYGCVDKSATIRSLYVSKMLPDNCNTWIQLCRYCLEDCINDFWPKLPESDRKCIWGGFVEMEFSNVTSTYWIGRMRNDLEPAIAMFHAKFYDADCSLEGTMFMYSFCRGQYSATKYFWELLNEDQRVRAIVNIDQKIFSDLSHNKDKNEFFAVDALGDLLMFLLAKSSEYCLDDIRIRILGSGRVLGQLLRWPYDNAFIETLKESLIHHDLIDYKPIIYKLWLNVQKQFAFLHWDLTYCKIFFGIWMINPKNFKSSIDYRSVLEMLKGAGDSKYINWILNDEDMRERNHELWQLLRTL